MGDCIPFAAVWLLPWQKHNWGRGSVSSGIGTETTVDSVNRNTDKGNIG